MHTFTSPARQIRRFAPLLLIVLTLLSGCASTSKQSNALVEAQHAWSGAVRWNDFRTAWQMVDPDYREAHPMSDLEFSRYEQLQVTGYRPEEGAGSADGTTRSIRSGVVNRHTMTERTVRYTEQWHWDETAQHWWNTSGLPDLSSSP